MVQLENYWDEVVANNEAGELPDRDMYTIALCLAHDCIVTYGDLDKSLFFLNKVDDSYFEEGVWDAAASDPALSQVIVDLATHLERAAYKSQPKLIPNQPAARA
jgi:hypothetical protein